MKKIIAVLLILSSTFAKQTYQDQLNRLQSEMEDFGSKVGVFSASPFQTGTSLSNYFLDEKTFLLQRDTFFQMKANNLETTEQVADFQHRTKVLRVHAGNILRQLLKSIKERNTEGFINIEEPKHQEVIDEIEKECEQDARCIADRLENPETNVENILINNFAFATNVFDQIPQMHSIEVYGVYMLVNQIYGELIYANNLLSKVEFEIFNKKQTTLLEKIEKNPYLTPSEKKLQNLLIKKVVNKWKKRILVRKYDSDDEFSKMALELKRQNQTHWQDLNRIRRDNRDVFGDIYKRGYCRGLIGRRKRKWCQSLEKAKEIVTLSVQNKSEFLGQEESELPNSFWGEKEQSKRPRHCHPKRRPFCKSKNLAQFL